MQGANTTCQAPNFSLTSKTRPLRACTHSHALAPLSCWSCCHRLCTVSLCLMTCSPSLTTTVHRTLAAQQRAVSSPSPATSKSHMTDVHRCRHALRFKPACLSPLSKQTHMKHVCLHFTCRPFFIAHTHTQTHTHTHSLSLSLFLSLSHVTCGSGMGPAALRLRSGRRRAMPREGSPCATVSATMHCTGGNPTNRARDNKQ